ncbi:MAG TPA: hypothetical protein DC049_10100 [Spirochaetia bacterium]|nr:hypothetical protein [Spirochaetia bacterium]
MQQTEISFFREDYLDDICGLLNRALPREGFTPNSLQHLIIKDPHFKAEDTIVFMQGKKITGFLSAVIRRLEQSSAGVIKVFAVDPAWQRQGIAGKCFTFIEQRFRAEGVQEIHVGSYRGRTYVFDGLPTACSGAWLFLNKQGYIREGTSFYMTAKLDRDYSIVDDEIAALAAEGIIIRKALSSDREKLLDWIIDEFGLGWKEATEISFLTEQPTVWICEKNGKISGFANYNSTFPGFFGPTGIGGTERGRGLGRILLLKCLQDLQKTCTRVRIPTDDKRLSFYHRSADANADIIFWRMKKILK